MTIRFALTAIGRVMGCVPRAFRSRQLTIPTAFLNEAMSSTKCTWVFALRELQL
jgi:hypothetical protein